MAKYRVKTIGDILQMMDAIGTDIVVWGPSYDEDGEEPIWAGSYFDVPFWVSQLELDYKNAEGRPPVSWRSSLGEDHKNRPGFVICVKDE